MTGTVHPITGNRWTDDDGDEWPLTGSWCSACGLPLKPSFDGQTMHPVCHGDHEPTAGCPECVAERRAHRRQVAVIRSEQFTQRNGGQP